MEKRKRELYFFLIMDSENQENLPVRSKDMFVSFGILPANPALLTRRYAIKAYVMDMFAWIILFLGIILNVIFIFIFLSLLGAI
jgi:hypothetical protein